MTETHEPCGRGHMKPVGQACGICQSLDASKATETEERDDE